MSADVQVAWGAAAAAHMGGGDWPAGSDGEPPGPDAEAGVAIAGGVAVARLATYVRSDVQGAAGLTGMVGHYAASTDSAGVSLLRAAAERLRARGADRVIGPINGSTWARYRFALDDEQGEAAPPFLGEPVNPRAYPRQFLAAGFREVAWYESRITRDVAHVSPRAAAAEATAVARGIVIGPVDLERFDDELRDLHALSLRAFRGNAYYTPLDLATFAAMYRPMRALLDPAFVLLARADARLVGYAFAYPDPLDRAAGRPIRLIVKTLAVDPEWRSAGLGGALVHRLHEGARERGLAAVVHALMHAENASVKISAHTAEVFRRYALYEHG